MFYITGDTHGNFDRIYDFCKNKETTQEDVLIILGDAGINYFGYERDMILKQDLSQLPITIFSVHGNHEERPFNLGYKEMKWNEGVVYYEEDYPNLLFAKDGEIYNFNGNKTIVIGGAYSVDKYIRLSYGWKWFADEQPSEQIKAYVEMQLNKNEWSVDFVFSHTTPYDYRPVWSFIPGIDQSRVDTSTEEWLQKIESRLSYREWFAGHYHVDSIEGPITLMFNDIKELS